MVTYDFQHWKGLLPRLGQCRYGNYFALPSNLEVRLSEVPVLVIPLSQET